MFHATQVPHTISRSSALHGDRSTSKSLGATDWTPDWPQDRSTRFTEHKYLSLLLGIERRFLDRPARRPVTISTELPRFPPIQNVKKKKKDKFLTTPLTHAGGGEVWRHSFITLAVYGAERSTLRPGLFNPGKEPLYPLNRRLGGPQRRSGSFRGGGTLDPTRTQTPDRPVRTTVTVLMTAKYRTLTTGVTQAVRTGVILRTVYSSGVLLHAKQKNRRSSPQHKGKVHSQQKNGLSSHLTKNTHRVPYKQQSVNPVHANNSCFIVRVERNINPHCVASDRALIHRVFRNTPYTGQSPLGCNKLTEYRRANRGGRQDATQMAHSYQPDQ